MGLDMYLRGEKYFWTDWEYPDRNKTEDGFKVTTHTLELGYWRKHPDLHGYIVQTFAEGKDECQQIHLDTKQMQQIIEAIQNGGLPHTEGFFFGHSDNDEAEKKAAIEIFQTAIMWSSTKQEHVSKDVYYQASW